MHECNVFLLGGLFGDPACDEVFDDAARVQAMLDFESALARAQAQCGVIPQAAAQVIAAQCHAAQYDLAALAQATALAGNPAIPLIKELTRQVAAHDADAARWVHWGATSQDVIDTGSVLQLRAAFDLLLPRLDALCACLATLAARERATGLPGRTLLQQAVPVTFGLKAAGWLDALQRARRRLHTARTEALVLHPAAPPAPWPRWKRVGWRWRRPWRMRCSCRCRRCPGTPRATAWWRWGAHSHCWPAAWARSAAMWCC